MLRTHTCGELRLEHVGSRVTLCGWAAHRRDHGGLLFLDLRDRYGVTQAVLEPGVPEEAKTEADRVRLEYVVRATGVVRARPDNMRNRDRATGDVEVVVDGFEILNTAEPVPISLADGERTSEDLALKYRYLQMRRSELREALETRARVNTLIRRHMVDRGFLEVETPSLLRSTPEGARDYLVPSRIHEGCFYSLLQSPQILKQLLMVGGLDRYWQIVRCFRDEDLRADRQPEFTQLDVEMSFVSAQDVQQEAEDLVASILSEFAGVEVPRPFPRMTYDEVMNRYGSDKPDLRFGLPVHDVTEILRDCGFAVFSGAVAGGGLVRALAVPAAHPMSRKALDGLRDVVVDRGAKGVAWCRLGPEGWAGPASRHLSDAEKEALVAATGVEDGGILLFLAGPAEVVVPASGDLRQHLGRTFDLAAAGEFAPLWVDDFPLLERDEDSGRWVATHHPFTAPRVEHEDLLETDPGAVRAQAYDLVVNGHELLGGSLRIHRPHLQLKMFAALGLSEEEARSEFGFLLDALGYGAPPHGGYAMGMDRLVTVLLGREQIRDVIAFPKTTSAADLMTGAPAPVAPRQLAELGIRLVETQPSPSDPS